MRNSLIMRWLDSDYIYAKEPTAGIDYLRALPFVLIHVACLAVFWVGVSPMAIILAVFLYALRVFAIGAFYHRYFSHRTFKTSRFFQLVFAVIGLLAIQRGPIWWAAHHRQHHAFSDEEPDAHSPLQHGFWHAHMGWFLEKEHFSYPRQRVADLLRFKELVFLNRFDWIVPLLFFISLYLLGDYLAFHYPSLATNGAQLLVWGGCISTVFVFHVTFFVNSYAHIKGKRPYQTKEGSRNNAWLALLTFGEGWHNNHHFFPNTARQGFKWYEIDLSFYLLKLLNFFGIISHLKQARPPKEA